MLCPNCKEENTADAIKCTHCDSTFGDIPAEPSLTAIPEKDNASLHARIDALTLSPKMKEKLHFVCDNLKGTCLGFPYYDSKGAIPWKMQSFWAFIFTIFYYLAKRMWRKTVTLVAIGVVFSLGLDFLEVSDRTATYLSIGLGVIPMQCAYYDIYRKEVLGEKFWW